jgi:hypothetical protein
MELIDQLTKTLGVNENQAKAGAGLLFKMAKDKMGSADFSKISSAVPDVAGLISGAPAGGGGFFSKLFGGGGLASLAGGFTKLGMDGSMVGKFVPIILSFVKSKGGDAASGLLAKVLK